MKKSKTQKGITLIALIITIIVLLILAVVAISAVQDDGIINYAQKAKQQYGEAEVNESTTLKGYLDKIKENVPTGIGTSIGTGEKEEDTEDTIEFKINGTIYTAKRGQTFARWGGGKYFRPTVRAGVEYDVLKNEHGEYLMYNGQYVNADSLIEEGREYTCGII